MDWVPTCESLSDCPYQTTCIAGLCQHKAFWPPSGLDIILGFVIFVLTGLANAAGIAGGSIIIPIVITIGGFSTHAAIPIVQTAIIGGAIVAAVFRVQLRHLIANKPRVDYDIALHLCMPVLLGTMFGVMLNAVTPELVILGLLIVTLGYTTYNVFSKAISLHKLQGIASAQEPLVDVRNQPGASPELMEIYREEAKSVPKVPILMIFAIFALVTSSAFVRGGKGVPSAFGFESYSTEYWGSTFVLLLIAMVFCYVTSLYLIKKDAHYETVGYPFDKCDFRWTWSRCSILVISGFLSGIAAGLLGLAGGVILAPFLLALKMRPEVANATCSFMVFFMCSTSFLQFATAGMVSYDYGAVYCLLTAAGSLIGVTLIEKYIKRMQSVVVFLLAIVVAMATLLLPVYGVGKIMQVTDRRGSQGKYV